MNTTFLTDFKHFGRLLGNIYLFLTPSNTVPFRWLKKPFKWRVNERKP